MDAARLVMRPKLRSTRCILNKNRESVAKMFKVGHNRSIDIPPLPGIFPNYTAPVVRQALDGERENHQP